MANYAEQRASYLHIATEVSRNFDVSRCNNAKKIITECDRRKRDDDSNESINGTTNMRIKPMQRKILKRLVAFRKIHVDIP